jgi:aspartate ammonia-lyase
MTFRDEHDLLGEMEIPEDVYWGIHTARAIGNFPLSGLRTAPSLIHAIALVKKACCCTNRDLGYLDEPVAAAIGAACDEIIDGRLDSQFPIDALQGGAGTSTNMNVNEVIANRALERMGYGRGDYARCHPLEHVNLHQSTNDVYPTALKVASIRGVRDLSGAAAELQGALQNKEQAFASVLTIGRTEMQDAVPVTLGAQFSSFADAIARDRWRTFKCEERLRVVNLGGTAVGTGITAPQRFIFKAVEKLRELSGCGVARAENMMDQTANMDPLVEVSGILCAHGANLEKIAGDLRLLHFAGEIRLGAVQAGSSIMPGKVNPVICEAVIQAGIKVQANHAIISQCASRGSLQINEFLPLLAHSLLESIDLLRCADRMLAKHVALITADVSVCEAHAFRSTTLVTALVPYIGYGRAQELVREYSSGAWKNDFRQFLVEKFGEDFINKALSPVSIMAPGHRDDTPQLRRGPAKG